LLKTIPEEKWQTVPPTIPWRPFVDGLFIPEIPTIEGVLDPRGKGKPLWLDAVLFSDCQSDVPQL